MAWESLSLALPACLAAFCLCPTRGAQGCSATGARWALQAGGHPAPSLAVPQAGKPTQESSLGFLFPERSLVYSWSNPKDILHQSTWPLTVHFPLDYNNVEQRSLRTSAGPPLCASRNDSFFHPEEICPCSSSLSAAPSVQEQTHQKA